MKRNKFFSSDDKKQFLFDDKELRLFRRVFSENANFRSPFCLQQCIVLARVFRSKFCDISRRKKSSPHNDEDQRTFQKAKIFDRLLKLYQRHFERLARFQMNIQSKLDHDQHYDIDGVTLINGRIFLF